MTIIEATLAWAAAIAVFLLWCLVIFAHGMASSYHPVPKKAHLLLVAALVAIGWLVFGDWTLIRR